MESNLEKEVNKKPMSSRLGDTFLLGGLALGVGLSFLNGDTSSADYLANVKANWDSYGAMATVGMTGAGYVVGKFVDLVDRYLPTVLGKINRFAGFL